MTVYVAHAPADREVADGLETFIERRGHFVELDDGQTALRPVQASDVVVLLLSKDFVFAPTRLRLEQRALDAWSEDRLMVVKLDHSIAPVGLRDLPALDASFEAQREFKWNELSNQISEKLRAARQREVAPDAPAPKAIKRSAGWGGIVLAFVLILPGIGALVVSTAIWLANRIGPTPGTFADLVAGIDAFGTRYGAPVGVTPIVFALAIALTFVAPLMLIAMRSARANKRKAQARQNPDAYSDFESAPIPTQAAPEASDAMFVSYARANADAVMPVIEAAKQAGRKFWLDQQGIGAGANWAGEIVRAIRAAPSVVVMCSKAAFESDHVKREIYLADRYHKKLLPVFIEQAEAPEDFEYFFAGVQLLNLFETPEAERPQALVRALGAS